MAELGLTLEMTSLQKSHHQPLHMVKLPLKTSISKTATKAINFQHKVESKHSHQNLTKTLRREGHSLPHTQTPSAVQSGTKSKQRSQEKIHEGLQEMGQQGHMLNAAEKIPKGTDSSQCTLNRNWHVSQYENGGIINLVNWRRD